MASIQLDTRLVFALRGVSYDFYEEVRRAPGNYHVRMTYHDGTLEIMSPQRAGTVRVPPPNTLKAMAWRSSFSPA